MRNVTIPRVIRCHMMDLSAHVVLMKTIFDYMFFFPWRRGPLNYACIECFVSLRSVLIVYACALGSVACTQTRC